MDVVAPGSASSRSPTVPQRYLTRSLSREHGFVNLRVEGTLPRELNGTFYRNGPALFERFGRPYSHPFEADGGVAAVRFKDGSAQGGNRLLRGREYMREEAAGRPLYSSNASWPRRILSSLRLANADTSNTKNVANTSFMLCGDDLLALYETNRPTRVEPSTLTVIDESDLGGVLRRTFSAHPKVVSSRKTTYNFGIQYGPRTALELYALPIGRPARRITELPIRAAVLLHDFVATDRTFVFFISPFEVKMLPYLMGLTTFAKSFEWAPQHGTEIVIVPIEDPERVTRFEVDAFFQWHFVNAFDEGGEIVVDVVTYPDSSTFHAIPTLEAKGILERVRVSPSSRKIARERVGQVHGDFPKVDPRLEGGRHRRAWLSSVEADRSGVVEVDTDTGRSRSFNFPSGQRGSEAVFIPRDAAADEGDGWLISLVYDERSDTSHWALFDAKRLPDGPIARAHLDHHVPMTFHGIWSTA